MLSHLLMLMPDQSLLAQAPDPNVPVLGIRNATMPGALAALAGSVIAIWILSVIDKLLRRAANVDDILRTIVVFFGIIGALVSIPLINSLANIFWELIKVFVGGSGWGFVLAFGLFGFANIVAIVLVIFGLYGVFKGDSSSLRFSALRGLGRVRVILLVILTSSFFTLPVISDIRVWIINNIALAAWNGFIAVYSFLGTHTITLN